MNLNIANELAMLRQMSNRELRTRFAELFGDDARTSNNRVWLIRRIAWRIQELAEAGLSERARKRAAALVNEADLRLSPPRLTPASPPSAAPAQCASAPPAAAPAPRPRTGTVLTRRYKGEMLHVQVLDHGFVFNGHVYKSLSAVAKVITGSHCSGNRFFGLTQGGDQ